MKISSLNLKVNLPRLESLAKGMEKSLKKAASTVEHAAVDAFEAATGAAKVVYRRDDARFDGAFVSPNGQVFPPGTPLPSVPAAIPKGGVKAPGTIVYVNGMGIEKDRQAGELQAVADKSGQRVVGLHNATEGWLGDFPQAAGDKLDLGHNPAVAALQSLVLKELDAGRPVQLMAHSHGALITSRALEHVRRALLDRGLSPAQAEAKLGSIRVETFGGAASRYPDGPRYVHYVNTADVQSAIYGMGLEGDPRRRNAGRGAEFRHFWDPHLSPVVAHDFPGTYLPQREPFVS